VLRCRDSLSRWNPVEGGWCQIPCSNTFWRWWWWSMVVDIIMFVDIHVWMLSWMCPLWYDLTICYSYDVHTCSLRYSNNGRQLYHGWARSPPGFSQLDFQSAYSYFWLSGCIFCSGLIVIIMVILIVMLIVMVMVMVRNTLSQVGCLY